MGVLTPSGSGSWHFQVVPSHLSESWDYSSSNTEKALSLLLSSAVLRNTIVTL